MKHSYPVVKKIDPKEITPDWIEKQFPAAKKVRASWYTGDTDQNVMYFESNN